MARSKIDHEPGSHDDYINAVAGLAHVFRDPMSADIPLVSPGLFTESQGWISEPRVYRPGGSTEMVSLYAGGPVVPKDSPRARANAAAARGGTVSDGTRQHARDLTEATHREAGGQGLYGSSTPVGVGWRRFDHPDTGSW